MEATKVLEAEHRVIERVLGALETTADRLDAGEAADPHLFVMAADFFKGFADGCHHRKEEGVLFPAMEAAGIPAQGGPIAVMVEEHERGRTLTARMRAAAERLGAGDAAARAEIVSTAREYVSLLREHIAKEDHVLFPMANAALSDQAARGVLESFALVEHEDTGPGVHERYLALADVIERKAGA